MNLFDIITYIFVAVAFVIFVAYVVTEKNNKHGKNIKK